MEETVGSRPEIASADNGNRRDAHNGHYCEEPVRTTRRDMDIDSPAIDNKGVLHHSLVVGTHYMLVG